MFVLTNLTWVFTFSMLFFFPTQNMNLFNFFVPNMMEDKVTQLGHLILKGSDSIFSSFCFMIRDTVMLVMHPTSNWDQCFMILLKNESVADVLLWHQKGAGGAQLPGDIRIPMVPPSDWHLGELAPGASLQGEGTGPLGSHGPEAGEVWM